LSPVGFSQDPAPSLSPNSPKHLIGHDPYPESVTSRERVCEVCGKLFKPKANTTGRFCSRKCFRIGITGENHPRYKPELHEGSCKMCGELLTKRWQTIFCSKRCYGRAISGENNRSFNPELRQRICEMCGDPLTVIQAIESNKFCSKKCYGKSMSGENNPLWRGGPALTECGYCGIEMTIARGLFNSREHHFCTDECYRSWYSDNRSGENSHAWRGGKSFEPYGLEFNKFLKKMIRERDDCKCQYCGTEEGPSRKLDIHHINYDKRDNLEENLISLCKSCHTKTNYRRWYWESYFKMKIQEKDSIQSRLHLIPQEE